MRVVPRCRLRDYWEQHPDCEGSLRAWYAVVAHAQWQRPQDVKEAFRTADVLASGRVMFNIRDNRYRLVV